MKHRGPDIDELLKHGLPSASSRPKEYMDSISNRALEQLLSKARTIEAIDDPEAKSGMPVLGFLRRWAPVLVAVALLLAIAGVEVWRQNNTIAGIESADGVPYRVVGNTLVLEDGSRVELREHSEIRLERADDGVKIRLKKGSVIVNAAKQPAGHLYVQTRDVTVSVVGTVFFVNAEEEGSRVAVIEGEVRVKHGETESTLKPGEQISTNPSIPALPVKEEVGWSRNADAHIALLLQSATAVPRDAFELASIRPTAFSHDGGGERGAGGNAGRRSGRPYDDPCTDAGPFFLKFDPSRVDITDVPVYGLIAWAQGIECKPRYGSDFLIGGPNWIRTDGYDIQANIPPGPAAYTEGRDFSMGAGRTMKEQIMTVRFRNMLQSLLKERFQLVLRKEIREMPAFVLTAAQSGAKLTPWKEGDALCLGNGDCRRTGASGQTPENISGQKQTMTRLAQQLEGLLGRTVVDRTGITGEYNYAVSFDWVVNPSFGPPRPPAGSPREPGSPPPSDQSLFNALEQTLGLRLEGTKLPMEVTVIERVERPSEN